MEVSMLKIRRSWDLILVRRHIGPQKPHNWPCMNWMHGSFSCIVTAFNHLRHLSSVELRNIQIYFLSSVNTSTHNWLRNCLSDSDRKVIRVKGIVTGYWFYVLLEPPELLGINQIYKNIIGDIAAKSLVLTSITTQICIRQNFLPLYLIAVLL